jgi:hypothetical protein
MTATSRRIPGLEQKSSAVITDTKEGHSFQGKITLLMSAKAVDREAHHAPSRRRLAEVLFGTVARAVVQALLIGYNNRGARAALGAP